MFATVARLSKASRAPLTPKRGNKDFYKGTRQAFLPGGRRTGAPGKHVIGGKAKYRLVDEKVRVYVAPPLEEIENSVLKPYVALGTRLNENQEMAIFSKFRTTGGLSPRHFLRVAREHTYAEMNPSAPIQPLKTQPLWMKAQRKLEMMPETPPTIEEVNALVSATDRQPGARFKTRGLRELEEVVPEKPW
ncbi:hypothetical protein JR316_0009257 [Psilocybe cubensis]|uniref:Uncharacterized protein n=2 Tax=Psilocybe cubensis TaxID=181762 RepID=A0ACB8GU97_PSICU|nr:hypothetical protein JR316_0009257 [Psilocybe cubensis]KAH9478796.1 hypothetical protein JR316_0009257 [Psilocybe cubensis]